MDHAWLTVILSSTGSCPGAGSGSCPPCPLQHWYEFPWLAPLVLRVEDMISLQSSYCNPLHQLLYRDCTLYNMMYTSPMYSECTLYNMMYTSPVSTDVQYISPMYRECTLYNMPCIYCVQTVVRRLPSD